MSERLLVSGSRGLSPTPRQFDFALALLIPPPRVPILTVVHGTAKGVDQAGAKWGEMRGHRIEPHPADWDKHGKAAGIIRNTDMGNSGINYAIFFWDGASSGTHHMIGFIQSIPQIPYVIIHGGADTK